MKKGKLIVAGMLLLAVLATPAVALEAVSQGIQVLRQTYDHEAEQGTAFVLDASGAMWEILFRDNASCKSPGAFTVGCDYTLDSHRVTDRTR